jgi:hypothetical protein
MVEGLFPGARGADGDPQIVDMLRLTDVISEGLRTERAVEAGVFGERFRRHDLPRHILLDSNGSLLSAAPRCFSTLRHQGRRS